MDPPPLSKTSTAPLTVLAAYSRHPEDQNPISLSTRPLRGMVFSRSTHFIHRQPWRELKSLPFVSLQIFTKAHGENRIIDRLLDHLYDPSTIPGFEEIRLRAASLRVPYAIRPDTELEFATAEFKYWPLETEFQLENPIKVIVVRVMPHPEDPPGKHGYYLIHYPEYDPWIPLGNQPLGKSDIFTDDEEPHYDYGVALGRMRPQEPTHDLWDIIEFNPDDDRRWILGLLVGVESINPFISFPSPKRDRNASEIDNEISKLVEPSRMKHQDRQKGNATTEVYTFVGQIYEYAGIHDLGGGIPVRCVWVNYGDGTRHLAQMPGNRNRIPKTKQEKIYQQRGLLPDGDIAGYRQNPELIQMRIDASLARGIDPFENAHDRTIRLNLKRQEEARDRRDEREQREREFDEMFEDQERRSKLPEEEQAAELGLTLEEFREQQEIFRRKVAYEERMKAKKEGKTE